MFNDLSFSPSSQLLMNKIKLFLYYVLFCSETYHIVEVKCLNKGLVPLPSTKHDPLTQYDPAYVPQEILLTFSEFAHSKVVFGLT